jgi:hypothetical protein
LCAKTQDAFTSIALRACSRFQLPSGRRDGSALLAKASNALL